MVSKDPYSWYLSYRNWASKCDWPSVGHHYIEEYNLFYGKFIELAHETDRILFVRYVELLKDANRVLDRLEKRMTLRKKLVSRIIFRTSRRVPQSSRFDEERRKYYLDEKYIDNYADDELDELNRHIDSEVVASLGYRIVERRGLKADAIR